VWITFITACVAGCVSEAPVQRPLERLVQSSRTSLCTGVLAEALGEVRRPGYTWQPGELESALRWAIAHSRDDCGGDVSGRALWREAIAAWGRVGGDEAGLALIGSLNVSLSPDRDPEEGYDALRAETEAALEALGQAVPLSGAVVTELLDWYARNAPDCAVRPYRDRVASLVASAGEAGALAVADRFPPTAEQGECAPGWLLSDLVAGAPDALRTRLLAQVASPEAVGEDLRALLALVDGTTGPLQDALASRGCGLAVRLARAALEGRAGELDPRDAVDDAESACAAEAGGAFTALDLRRRLTAWMIEHGEAEEAWTTVDALSDDEIEETWLGEVGRAVIDARLARSAPLEAAAALDRLVERLGAQSSELVLARDAVIPALLTEVQRCLDDGLLPDARRALDAAERAAGGAGDTARLRAVVSLREASVAAASGECLTEQEMSRLQSALEQTRDGAGDEPAPERARADQRRVEGPRRGLRR
jgi:hypothetical protein